jgi:splicing factor 3A subunit 2
MSSFEQRIEPPSKFFQYLLIAAEPYETIGFKLQSKEVDKDKEKYWSFWDKDTRIFHFQFFYKR